jgi:Mg2+-importing ATPase
MEDIPAAAGRSALPVRHLKEAGWLAVCRLQEATDRHTSTRVLRTGEARIPVPAQSNHNAPYWSRPAASLLEELKSSADGLGVEEADRRLEMHGPNLLEAREQVTALSLFLNQFKSPIMLILLFATVVSAVTREWVDAVIILLVLLGSAVLSFTQEYNANNAAAKLRAQVTIKATALRGGEKQAIPADQMVPGDVILLSAGSLVPADGVLLEGVDLFVNQAVLTGETFPVEKVPGVVLAGAGLAERTNCVFMGTNIRSGTGRALIVETGKATAFGQIAGRLTLRPPETEFERGIRHFGTMLTQVMMLLVFIVFAVNVYFDKPVLDALLFSLALAVGLTPELLPAIISINLSKGSQTMAANGVIVRRLESIENLGSMNVLCTDKTGTLTEGVVQLDGALDVDGNPSDQVLRLAYLNAQLQTGLANPLDEAVVARAREAGIDIRASSKVDEVPYDFVRKRLSVAVHEGDSLLIITKGALENVLAVCTQVQQGSDAVHLDQARLAEIHARHATWSEQGFRVLGLATKPQAHCHEGSDPAPCTRADEREMVFLGFLLFFDPPKPGTQETIASLAERGVHLKIITGDNKLVALHTAAAVGMQVTGVLTGADLDELGDEALWQAADRANLFAEVDPNQKERVILALKKRGHVVGYLGDGINDAPALHAADVGISVDTAVDVAKEAADFVLLQRDLGVLRRGIELGRTTFANTLKYVFVTTSANFGNMFSMAGASLFLPFLPMLPLQILLTNFITDFPAMAIAGDAVDAEMVERPRRWNTRFIRDFMITFGAVSSVFDYLTFGVLLWVVKASQDQFRTGWFLESVLTELLIMLVIRTRKPFFHSRPGRYLLIGTVTVALVTIVLPFCPLNSLLGFTSLPPGLLAILAGITGLYIVATELVKLLFYRHMTL